jgi:LGFP repeat-containing protein
VTATGGWAKPKDGMPGGFSSISANGNANGIIWTLLPHRDGQWSKVPGVLVAFDAKTLVQLWADESAISFAKFCPPTIADGKVIRATFASDVHHGIPGKFIVYGHRTLIHPPITMATPSPLPPREGGAEVSADARAATPSATAVRHAAIEEAYWAHGGPHGTLGVPVGEEQSIGDSSGGRFRDYESLVRGSPLAQASARAASSPDLATCHAPRAGEPFKLWSAIYWTAETGAHVVEGEILALWREMGAEKSTLGYPISDETNTDDATGRVSRFQKGEIEWYFESGAKARVKTAPGGP